MSESYSFTVNGVLRTTQEDKPLLRYLRDTLHLTGVKDGCSEGACGTCTVLIDGKPTKACIPQTDKLEGKHIITVEGLTDFEKQVYTYAFGMAGAVQCGFCIPGMVMCAKGLLDTNPAPTREEAAYAIRNNICRCTGYVKIIDAILLAAELFRRGEVPPAPEDWSLGARVPRVDVEEKVTGTGIYPDDIYLDGMIYGSAVRSQYPRARVLAIHTEEARALPGVVGVFTAADIPGQNKVGHLVKDWDTMIAVGDITHYLGDAICLVAAEDQETLERAKSMVRVDYEELPMVRSPREAMLPDAPPVHRTGNLLTHKHIQRGNPAEAIAKSRYVLTQHFSTPWTEHAFLEPECAVAYPDGDTLEEVLQQADVVTAPQKQVQRGNKSVLLLLLLLVLGLFFAGYPYGAWYIEWGWHFKGAEPSPGALLFNRVIGILLLIGTLVWFLFL